MKIINLDQFRAKTPVTIDGIAYEVLQRSVEDFINSDIEDQSEAAQTPKEKIEFIVSVIMRYSDIPRDVLLKQNIGVLNAILQLANGVDITAEMEMQQKAQADEGGGKN